jgi:hypothetical protein
LDGSGAPGVVTAVPEPFTVTLMLRPAKFDTPQPFTLLNTRKQYGPVVLKLPDWPPDLISEQLPLPPELELLDEELELLLDEELELLDEDELDDELELEEPPPLQSAACGPLPVTVRESMFANPPLLVATRLISLCPAFRNTFALANVQLVQEPVEGKSVLVTVPPLICTLPGRLLDPFA